MISSTKKGLRKFSLFLLVGYSANSCIAFANPDYRPVPAIKNYSVINGKNSTLVISKNSKIIVLKTKDYTFTRSIETSGKQIFELRTHQHNNAYTAFATNTNQVGLLLNQLHILQNEAACTPTLKDAISELLKNDLTEKIEDFAYSDRVTDNSCTPQLKNKISGIAASELNPKSSFAIKCLTSKEVQKKLPKNPDFEKLATKLVTSYASEIDRLEKGSSDLNFKCKGGAVAEYDPAQQAVIFPVTEDNLAIDPCKGSDQVFAHELFHHAGLTEDEAKIFDSICGNVLKVNGTKDAKCKEVYKNTLFPDGSLSALSTAQMQKKQNNLEREKAVEVLKQEIKTAEFVPVQDADIQEITNPTTPERYNKSVDRVYTAMSTNLEKMAQPLNRAIAASVNTAEAATTTTSISSGKVRSTYKKSSLLETSSARSPASNSRASANQEYTVEEILADKYNVPVESVRAAAASAELPTAATTTPNTANSRQAKQQAPRGGNSRELAGAGSGAGLNSATQDGVPGRSTSSGPRANSRQPANTGGPTVQDNTVKDMSSFNEIRGERYRRIQERYTDPEFAKQLADENVGLEYKSKNMTIRIGDMSNKRKALFRDDGSALKKVTGAR